MAEIFSEKYTFLNLKFRLKKSSKINDRYNRFKQKYTILKTYTF